MPSTDMRGVVLLQVTTIINVNYEIDIQTTTVNYNDFTCICCYNSCNNYIIVVQPGNPPAPTADNASPPPPSASPPPAVAPSPAPLEPTIPVPAPENSPPPPPAIVSPPPPMAPAPAPEGDDIINVESAS